MFLFFFIYWMVVLCFYLLVFIGVIIYYGVLATLYAFAALIAIGIVLIKGIVISIKKYLHSRKTRKIIPVKAAPGPRDWSPKSR